MTGYPLILPFQFTYWRVTVSYLLQLPPDPHYLLLRAHSGGSSSLAILIIRTRDEVVITFYYYYFNDTRGRLWVWLIGLARASGYQATSSTYRYCSLTLST